MPPAQGLQQTDSSNEWPWDLKEGRCLGLKLWAVLIAVGLLAAAAKQASAANVNPAGDDAAVQSATYSTGQSGGKLKWLPQRPDSAASESNVNPVGYTAPAASPRPVRTAQNEPTKANRALSDPFGDKKVMPPPAPPEKLGADLQQMPLEPKPQGSLPGLSVEEPPVMEKPSPVQKPSASEQPYVAPHGSGPFTPLKPLKADLKQSTLGGESQYEFKEGCPSPKDLKPIRELTTNIVPSEGELPHDCPLGNAKFEERQFASITYAWTASGLCHKPLYFEDVQLERYGHMAGPWVQPFASAAHFFLTVPILPYKMGLETPNECMYTLGYYRPGDCAPYLFDPIPLSVRGTLFEAGAWAGACAAFP